MVILQRLNISPPNRLVSQSNPTTIVFCQNKYMKIKGVDRLIPIVLLQWYYFLNLQIDLVSYKTNINFVDVLFFPICHTVSYYGENSNTTVEFELK